MRGGQQLSSARVLNCKALLNFGATNVYIRVWFIIIAYFNLCILELELEFLSFEFLVELHRVSKRSPLKHAGRGFYNVIFFPTR